MSNKQYVFGKLHHEFENNPDIVFIGISLDEEQDRQKWQTFVEKINCL